MSADPSRTDATARTVLVTGGVRGIGRALGLRLARRGWRVAACYRTSRDDATSFEQACRDRGGRAWTGAFDVADPAACRELVAEAQAALGPIDVLVHAAGPYHRVPLLEESDEGWRGMFDGNLHALFTLARLVAPGMRARGWGRILAFAIAGADRLQARPNVTAHYAAKAGVLVLVRTLARLLAPDGVTVNSLSPGFIDSGSDASLELGDLGPRIPAGYVGRLDDAVAAAEFLLSDEARYVNGADLTVSGGWGL